MKTLLFTLTLAVGGVSVGNAQIYRPSVVGHTTVLGAVAGALIGGHNHDRWAEGAVIGAAAGAVLGSIVDDSRPVVYSQREIAPVVVVPCAPVVTSAPPQVVYVNSPPPTQVVYVESYPRPVYVPRPVVYVSAGWTSGRYTGHGYQYGHRYNHHRRR